MLKQKITVHVQTTVSGPNGKLKAGSTAELEDSAYIRLLIKSGAVALVDPPSLDPEFLETGGYELQDGHSYESIKKADEEKKAKAAAKKEPKKIERKKVQRKVEPVPAKLLAEDPKKEDSKESVSEEKQYSQVGSEVLEEGHPEARGPESKLAYGEVPTGSSEGEVLEEGHPEARDQEQ